MKKLVLFASGNGTNAQNIMRFFADSPLVEVASVFTNKAGAGVVDIASTYNVEVTVFSKAELNGGEVLEKLCTIEPDLIVLAGFLLHVPETIVKAFPNKIVNIHPALLPKYGGAGMYGMNVHRAVMENREKETGISIHYVNEHYDKGAVVFQKSVDVSQCSSLDEIALKVRQLEHEHFPRIISQLLES